MFKKLRVNLTMYVDSSDIISMGYEDKALGKVVHVINNNVNNVLGQHMFGGYLFDSSGKILTWDGMDKSFKNHLHFINKFSFYFLYNML